MDINKIFNDFRVQGYCELPTKLSAFELQSAVDSYRELIRQNNSADLEAKTFYSLDDSSRVRLGHKDKSTEDGFDSKCYFHFNPDMLGKTELHETLESYDTFLSAINTVNQSMWVLAADFINALGSGGFIDPNIILDGGVPVNSNLRILNYKPTSECQTLAKEHMDRGIFTIAIYETDRGLYVRDKAVEYHPGTVKIFPSSRWNEFISEPFDGTLHRVEKIDGNEQRSSIVMFFSPRNIA